MAVKRLILAILLSFGILRLCSAVDTDTDSSSVELAMANRIEPIVKQIGNVSKAWVWVKIETDLERWRAFLKTLTPATKNGAARPPSIPRSVDVLPGVNTDEMVGLLKSKEQPANRSTAARGRAPDYDTAVKMASWFQRVSVRIAVPDTIAPERLADLKSKLPILIGLNLDRGDTLVVETIPDTTPIAAPPVPKSFRTRLVEWLDQVTPGVLALWLGALAFIAFIFGPIRTFLRDAAVAMQTIRVQSQTSSSIDTRTEPQDALLAGDEEKKALAAPHPNPLPQGEG